MKRAISVILSLCMLFSLSLTACASEETQNETTIILKIGSPTMTVNDEEMPIDEQGTVPVILDNRTLLPVRAIVEKMGGTVGWDGETQEVTLNCGGDKHLKSSIPFWKAMIWAAKRSFRFVHPQAEV